MKDSFKLKTTESQEEEKHRVRLSFKPQIGLKTYDCYLHRIGNMSNLCNSGVIEFVGRDYFILRDLHNDEVVLVREEEYDFIPEGDFR